MNPSEKPALTPPAETAPDAGLGTAATGIGLAADRGKPGIGPISNSNRLVGIVVFSLAFVATVIAVVVHNQNKSAPKPVAIVKSTAFQTGGHSSQYIDAAADAAHDNTGLMATEKNAALQQAALQQAIEEQKKLNKRLQSPQLVYDQPAQGGMAPSASGSPAATSPGAYQVAAAGIEPSAGATAATGAPSSAGALPTDANLAFAAQNADKSVETATASQLPNLHTLIAQGAMIPGILETAISSDLPGMVRAVVSENIYSFDGFSLVIPEQSHLIGQYRAGLVNGQSRVFIIWTRLIRPDGVSINVGSYGTDALGRSGLAGDVDSHFFERFGSSVMLSMIDSGLQAAANSTKNPSTTSVAINTGNDFSSAAAIALQNSINIPPTINIDQGARINVFVGKDLDFSRVGALPQRDAADTEAANAE